LQYVERLHREIGAADARLAALVGVREALAAKLARRRERESGGVSRGEFDRGVRAISESLRRKQEELDRLQARFAPEAVARQCAVAASARAAVSHRILLAAALKRETARIRRTAEPAFVTQSGFAGAELMMQRSGVKRPVLPPLELPGMETTVVAEPCFSDRPTGYRRRFPRIAVPTGPRVGEKTSGRRFE
jgi:hypothetical protein